MEIIEPLPHILIAGGGHVGRCVALVADSLGWDYTVFDVREEYSNFEKYPFSSEVISMEVSDFLESENIDSLQRFSDVLLLGHDWSVDQELLLIIGIEKRKRQTQNRSNRFNIQMEIL